MVIAIYCILESLVCFGQRLDQTLSPCTVHSLVFGWGLRYMKALSFAASNLVCAVFPLARLATSTGIAPQP